MTTWSVEDLATRLTAPSLYSDVFTLRILMSKAMTLSHGHVELTPLIPALVKLLAHPDLLVKKISSQLLVRCSGSKSDLMLLAVNTVLRDTQDSNPTIRGIALRTMCQMKHGAFSDQRLECILTALKDPSAYVRRSAVCACAAIGRQEAEEVLSAGLVDQLYHLVRDPDPLVVINCLLALEEVLQAEQGVVLSRSMVRYLLSRLADFDAWGLAYLLKQLKKYVPKSEDEVFSMMDVLDPLLSHQSTMVCVHSLELFLHLTKEMKDLAVEVFKRMKSTFLSVFASGNTEMMICVLQFLREYPDIIQELFSGQYRSFFCRHKDAVPLKEQKLLFISLLINTENFKDILEEIVISCKDRSQSVSLCAVQSLRSIIVKFPEISDSLLKAFQTLLTSGSDHVQSNALQVLVTLPEVTHSDIADLMTQLCPLADKIHDSEGRIAILTLIGRYGETLREGAYTLEYFLDIFSDLAPEVKGHVLTTSLRLFQKKPPECQRLLGEILELCLQDDDRDLNEQAKFYYALLENLDKLQSLQFD